MLVKSERENRPSSALRLRVGEERGAEGRKRGTGAVRGSVRAAAATKLTRAQCEGGKIGCGKIKTPGVEPGAEGKDTWTFCQMSLCQVGGVGASKVGKAGWVQSQVRVSWTPSDREIFGWPRRA